MDMNPNSANYTGVPQQPLGGQMLSSRMAPAPAQPTGPNPNNGTAPGGVAAMIKALMDGNNQYKQQQQMASLGKQPPMPGAPMSLAPPSDPTTMMGGGMGQTAGIPPEGANPMAAPPVPGTDPFSSGAAPMNIDPVTQALFSPIPGAGGY